MLQTYLSIKCFFNPIDIKHVQTLYSMEYDLRNAGMLEKPWTLKADNLLYSSV